MFTDHCRLFLSLLNVGQVILDLLRCQTPETIHNSSESSSSHTRVPEASLVADADLDVVFRHLTLEPLLESEDGGVHGVLQLQVLRVPEVITH